MWIMALLGRYLVTSAEIRSKSGRNEEIFTMDISV